MKHQVRQSPTFQPEPSEGVSQGCPQQGWKSGAFHRHGPIHHWLEAAARSFQQYLLWGWVERTLKARAWRERDRGEGCESWKDAEGWRCPHSEEGWGAPGEHRPCLPQAPRSGDMLEGRHSSSHWHLGSLSSQHESSDSPVPCPGAPKTQHTVSVL